MSSARKAAVAVVLIAFATGCRHKAKPALSQAAQAPPIPLSVLANSAPLPELPPLVQPAIHPPGTSSTMAETKLKPRKPAHRTRPKRVVEADQAPSKDQPAASTGTSADASGDMSPIGQLSAAGESTNMPRRHEILDEINSTQAGLNGIKRPLSQEETVTANQIRTFLAKAKDALDQEDLDGAHTLVTKARVLLNELMK